MPENREELLAYYRKTRADLLAAIQGLTDQQLIEPSLDGWSVKDHLAHIAFWDEHRVAEVIRISAGHESALKMTVEQDEIFNALGYAFRRTLPLEQVRWELATKRQNLLDAISTAPPRGLDPTLYGEAGLRSTHETQHTDWILRWRAERGI